MEFENDPSNNPDGDSLILKIISFILITLIVAAPIVTIFKMTVIDHYMHQ